MKLFLIPEHISIQIVRMISLVSMGILLLLIVIPQFIGASLWGHLKLTKSVDDGSPGSVSETSPSGKKKKLVELFQESIRDDHDTTEPNTSSNQDTATEKIVKPTIQDILPPKSVDGTPYVSGANSCCSSERTVNGDNPIFKEKPLRSVQCCLPSLVSCSSFSERKKKMSPAIAANDKP
ncbi:hypothetical protein GOBAR_AA17565 [Gossypium barbadense]|uniref:Uncharacterized protein n=1 Tax=Gossypium barbadense TaxID=3634 RepID=A0A2P5XIG0_GOSBA|nr:hypothetical protein GOBAR_AA17565 [Gossypium barbadense]